ncbi:hypothetical protein Tco_1077007 [Tanacetum coccineum]
MMDQGEDLVKKSTDKGSKDTVEVAHVLSTIEATNVLSSGGAAAIPIDIATIATAGVATASRDVPTTSGNVPTVAIFTTASITTPYTRRTRASKGIIIESSHPPHTIIVLRSHAGWKAKDFKGMTFEQIKETFTPVWKSMQNFVPMESIPNVRVKRLGFDMAKDVSKRLKTDKVSGSEPSQEQQPKEHKELSKEKLKKMIEIVPVEEIYVEALQVKRLIIAWEVYSEGEKMYWKIIRVGDYTEIHQTFEDMLKKLDKEDLDKLWSLVKEAVSTGEPIEDKAKELWVELKRIYEPDTKDQLWALQRYMHDPLEWKLYDTCGVHHMYIRRGHEIFMLVEKDYPLTKGLATLMICNKL